MQETARKLQWEDEGSKADTAAAAATSSFPSSQLSAQGAAALFAPHDAAPTLPSVQPGSSTQWQSALQLQQELAQLCSGMAQQLALYRERLAQLPPAMVAQAAAACDKEVEIGTEASGYTSVRASELNARFMQAVTGSDAPQDPAPAPPDQQQPSQEPSSTSSEAQPVSEAMDKMFASCAQLQSSLPPLPDPALRFDPPTWKDIQLMMAGYAVKRQINLESELWAEEKTRSRKDGSAVQALQMTEQGMRDMPVARLDARMTRMSQAEGKTTLHHANVKVGGVSYTVLAKPIGLKLIREQRLDSKGKVTEKERLEPMEGGQWPEGEVRRRSAEARYMSLQHRNVLQMMGLGLQPLNLKPVPVVVEGETRYLRREEWGVHMILPYLWQSLHTAIMETYAPAPVYILQFGQNADGSVRATLELDTEVPWTAGRQYPEIDYVMLLPLGIKGGIARPSKEAVVEAIEGLLAWSQLRGLGQVTMGLIVCHARGLRHRDFKTANIIVELLDMVASKRMEGLGSRDLLGALPDGPVLDASKCWLKFLITDLGEAGDMFEANTYTKSEHGTYDWSIQEVNLKVAARKKGGDTTADNKLDVVGLGLVAYFMLTHGASAGAPPYRNNYGDIKLRDQTDVEALVSYVEKLGSSYPTQLHSCNATDSEDVVSEQQADIEARRAGAAMHVLQSLPGGSALLAILRRMVSTDIDSMPSLEEVLAAVKADMAALGALHGLSDEIIQFGANF